MKKDCTTPTPDALQHALEFDESSPMSLAPETIVTLGHELQQTGIRSHHQTHQVLQAIQLLQGAVGPRE